MSPDRNASALTPLLSTNLLEDDAPIYGENEGPEDPQSSAIDVVSAAVRQRLYISHILSTWSSRVFEIGAILYLADIFPGTLLPVSVYALARGASATILSPAVGRYIDTRNRLHVVRVFIVLQRLVVAASCILFWFLVTGLDWVKAREQVALAVLAVLACIEKLCAIMNLVAIERDWVVVIAQKDENALRHLNAMMRRIDLICKLAGPFFISILDTISAETAILVNLGMNVASVAVEYYCIARVYQIVPQLGEPKGLSPIHRSEASEGESSRTVKHFLVVVREEWHELGKYFRHRAFLPSFSSALLNLTALSFSGQMITFLISVGWDSILVGAARSVSVAFELSATWITPRVNKRIGPLRSAIWFISWQMACLAAGTSVFWVADKPLLSASGLLVGASLSRVGMWGFSMSTQVIIQEEVEVERRGSFSSVEASWQNAFELCSYATTIIFSRPEQFQWPVLITCIAVFTAGGLYACFVRMRRGHLFHFNCIEPRQSKTTSTERCPAAED